MFKMSEAISQSKIKRTTDEKECNEIHRKITGGPVLQWLIYWNEISRESKFELQSCYYIHFWINTLWKSINPFISEIWVK